MKIVDGINSGGCDCVRRHRDSHQTCKDVYRICYVRGPEGILIGLAEQIG